MTLVTPELVEQVRVLRASGLSLRQIGAQVGRPFTTVQHIMARFAPQTPPEPPPRPAFHVGSPGRGCCAWPINAARPWRFCPEAHEPGRVYCLRHHRLGTVGRSWHAEAAE